MISVPALYAVPAETSVEQGYTWETATSTTKKFSLNYSNDTGENQVIVYRRPVTTYRYEIKGTKIRWYLRDRVPC